MRRHRSSSSHPPPPHRRPRLRVPLDGHPAGYILVAILTGTTVYGIMEQEMKEQQKETRQKRKSQESQPTSAIVVSSSSAAAPVSLPSASPISSFVPSHSMHPFPSAQSSTEPHLNLLTTLTHDEIDSHPLLVHIKPFGLPVLPFDVNQRGDLNQDAIHPSPPLLLRHSYLTAYNTKTRTADWVLERLTREQHRSSISSHGDSSSSPSSISRDHCSFQIDQFIHPAFQSHNSDYRSSGYDRGHLVPAADVAFTCDHLNQEAVCETFALSNIAPQNHQLNRGYWLQVENHVRNIVQTHGEVFAITGGLYIPHLTANANATESSGATETHTTHQLTTQVIGSPPSSFVHVPTHFFKILLVVPPSSLVASSSSSSSFSSSSTPYLASFIIPNVPVPLTSSLKSYQVPLEQIELYAGWQFFPRIARKTSESANGRLRKNGHRTDSATTITANDLCAQSGACEMKIREFNFANGRK